MFPPATNPKKTRVTNGTALCEAIARFSQIQFGGGSVPWRGPIDAAGGARGPAGTATKAADAGTHIQPLGVGGTAIPADLA